MTNERQNSTWDGRSDPWQQILQHLQSQLDEKALSDWLRPVDCEPSDNGCLGLRVPNATMRDWIETKYRPAIEKAIAELALPYRSIQFLVGLAAEKALGAATGTDSTDSLPLISTDWKPDAAVSDLLTAPLNPRYRFASFVVGSSNQFAHAAASRVANEPGRIYNPLFLYGGAGLGKTHLMQAIAQSLRQRYPKWRVLYISAERFTNEMVQSLKNESMVTFHERFRNLEALLVDDIQFLTRKERTQEEFFHTFNALFERQSQIVLSSDRPPKEIDEIEERLRSRFEWGLIADLQPPDLETRQAILMKKAEAENFPLSEKIAFVIASNVKSNIRELEGSLIRLMAFASLTGEEITEPMARQLLNDLIYGENRKITVEFIQRMVCEHFGLRLSELKARDNSKRVVHPRQIAMWLTREATHASLPEIARAFGDKHHTTVLHSINKISKQRSQDKDLNRLLNKFLNQLE